MIRQYRMRTTRNTWPKWAAYIICLFVVATIIAVAGSLAFAMQMLDVWTWSLVTEWLK